MVSGLFAVMATRQMRFLVTLTIDALLPGSMWCAFACTTAQDTLPPKCGGDRRWVLALCVIVTIGLCGILKTGGGY